MKRIVFLLSLILFSLSLNAAEDDVTITTTGEGSTRDNAVQSALRSAIEQVFGTFISANTTILNDELIKDEIVSLSTGNIKSYDIISILNISEGKTVVTVESSVSVNQLISYAKNHGSSTEFEGKAFLANIKKRELDKKSEWVALTHLKEYVKEHSRMVVDFSVVVSDPQVSDDDFLFPTDVVVKANSNYYAMVDYLQKTLRSISLSEDEAIAWANNNMKVYYKRYFSSRIPLNDDGYYFRTSEKRLNVIVREMERSLWDAIWSWRLLINMEDGPKIYRPIAVAREREMWYSVGDKYLKYEIKNGNNFGTEFYGLNYDFHIPMREDMLNLERFGNRNKDEIFRFYNNIFFTREEVGNLKDFAVEPSNQNGFFYFGYGDRTLEEFPNDIIAVVKDVRLRCPLIFVKMTRDRREHYFTATFNYFNRELILQRREEESVKYSVIKYESWTQDENWISAHFICQRYVEEEKRYESMEFTYSFNENVYEYYQNGRGYNEGCRFKISIENKIEEEFSDVIIDWGERDYEIY